jgi:hypothetical protein
MFKKVGVFGIIIIAITFIAWSSNYIYNKQNNAIHYNSYCIADSATVFFIPNANRYLQKEINAFEDKQNVLPKSLNIIHDYLLKLPNYDFNSKISTEIYCSFYLNEFSIVFKNHRLNTNTIIAELLSELKISTIFTPNEIHINDTKFYFKKQGDFFIFSSKEINANKENYQITNLGNFDYSMESRETNKKYYYKNTLNKKHKYSKKIGDKITGKPINPDSYFKITPSDFNELHFYSSTRMHDDISTLMKIQDNKKFYAWIENSLMHIKKDSMELIIGIQNNLQNLKYLLDEQTLNLSADSLLPTSIFRTNFEISFFQSDYNWKLLLPESTSNFTLYSELNNYNILANSMEAMNWYIRENQMGNNYYDVISEIPIPQKTHRLHIIKNDTVNKIITENWINKTKCFRAETFINNSKTPVKQSRNLINSYLIVEPVKQISSFKYRDSLFILTSNNNTLMCHDIYGNNIWTAELKSPLLKKPVVIDLDNDNIGFVLFMENQVNIIDFNNKPINGFPYLYKGLSKDGIIVKYDQNSEYRILININNQLVNLNINGNLVEGWNSQKFSGHLDSKIHYNSSNGKDYIYFKDSFDTLHVLNRSGESRFDSNYKLNFSNKTLFITGDISRENLRVLSYKNGYILSHFISNGHQDSLKINRKINSEKSVWSNINEKPVLLIEEFDRLLIFNEFGLIENEILKPEANTQHLFENDFDRNRVVFVNSSKNQLYLLNSFGKLINLKPTEGNSLFTSIDGYFIVYFNSQIMVYNLN